MPRRSVASITRPRRQVQEVRDVAIAVPGKKRVGGEARAQQALGLAARTTGDDRELPGAR